MRFTCKKCKTKYTIADERIRGKAVKFRCKRCNTLLVVRTQPSPVLLDKPKQTLEREREAAIRSRKQAEEKQRRAAEAAQKTAQAAEEVRRQEELYRKRCEERERKTREEKDTGRQDLLKRVLKRREKARADRTADRISGHFFDDGEEGNGEDKVLPPPPVSGADRLADQLERESILEEHEDLQRDPLAVLVERDKPGLSEISKVLAVQAGMGAASKGRRLTITLLCVVGILAVLGGGVYLAVSQGWFGGFGSARKSKSGEGRSRINVATGELSDEEAKRLRDSLWKVERKSPGGRIIGLPGFDLQVPMERARKKTQEEKKLQAFYRAQGKEKRELTPRIPDSALLPTPTTIDLPTAPVSSLDAPLLTKKSEMTPTGPERTTGPERLSEFQVRVVIQKHYQQVKSCLERQLKRDASISGKMYVVARVSPNGKVGKVRIATPKFNGTFVEECLTKEVRRWEFPTFKGEAYDLTFPLLLTARQTY